MSRIAVVIDSPINIAEIALGLSEHGELTLVCADPNYPLLPMLQELGEVIMAVDGVDDAAGWLAASRPDAIVTFNDSVMPLTAKLAARLELPFHSRQVTERLIDKAVQRARLAECGVEELRSATLRSAADWPMAVSRVGLPAVLKPIRGNGSRDVYLITGIEQGRELADRLLGPGRCFILEEYLVGRPCWPFGDFVSVESIVSDGQVRHLAITGKLPMSPPFREVGHCWPSALAEHEQRQVKELVSRAVTALGVRLGLTHTEVKLTPDGPRIIEVNGRLGGFINDFARSAYRLDLIDIAGRLALGQPLPPMPGLLDRVYFQYLEPTPTTAFTLASSSGAREVRKLPGIIGFRSIYEPGVRFEPSVMTRYFHLIIGSAEDYAEMFWILDEVRNRLRYRISFVSGEREFTGQQLLEYAEHEPAGDEPMWAGSQAS
jgi:biotin carboxylase